MFSEKATKIDDEDFVDFCGLLRKHELYSNEMKNILEKVYLHE